MSILSTSICHADLFPHISITNESSDKTNPPHRSGLSGISIEGPELLSGGPEGGPAGGPEGGPEGGPAGGPEGGPAGGPEGGPVATSSEAVGSGVDGGAGGPDGGLGGGVDGITGGVGGGVDGVTGGVGGPGGGRGTSVVRLGVGASLTDGDAAVCASNGSSVREGCESGASLIGLAFKIGASCAP